MSINARGRGRIAAALVASAALVGTAATVTAQPAASVPADTACTPTYPMASLQADLDASPDGTVPVTGLTVTRGTAPVEFSGDVIGVLDDGIAPGLDMIIARIDVAGMNVPDVSGIWAGMSGSPVYSESGDLIGAVAYGLAYGESNVAGITPYEDMQGYLASGGARSVPVSKADARTIAARSSVTTAQAEQGLEELRIPQRVAGLSSQRVTKLKEGKKYDAFRQNDYLVKKIGGVGGNAVPGVADAGDIVAGGNLAAAASYGDITFGGVGTATNICDNRVVAFGHPFGFMGDTSLTLHPADAIYVQDDPVWVPFKVANLALPVGTVDGDHLAGISGSFGELPPLTTVSSTVSYRGRDRTGASNVSVPDANASVTFYEQLANHDRVLDAIVPGTEHLDWTITGTNAGAPFELSASDVYTSTYDIAFESPWDVADLVWALSSFEDVTVTGVSTDGAVDDNTTMWEVTGLQQKIRGELVTVNRRHPATAHLGGTLRVLATLESTGTAAPVTVPLSFAVPKKAGRHGYLDVEGGSWQYTPIWRANDFDDVQKMLAKSVSNDQVAGTLYSFSRRHSTRTRAVSEPTGQVVFGSARAEVRIKR